MMSATHSTAPTVRLSQPQPERTRTLFQDGLRYLLRDRLTMAALTVLATLTLICALGPPVVENLLQVDVNRTNSANRFLPPGTEGHLLGTDHLGRDQLIRLMYGGQVSLAIAYSASLMIILIGIVLGLLSGYYGGRIDDLITWAVTTLNSIPPLFILLVVAALWQPNAPTLILILALTGWTGTTRLVRAEVLSFKERDYVLAARALGARDRHLLISHIVPNLLSIVIVTATIIAGNLILIESGLSFLGVGVQPPVPTWGNMLTDSRTFFATGVHLVVWPGLMIMITVMCFYLLGDGLRDALDPHRVRLGPPRGSS
jgi:peptide/nickel transport system permease protein